MIMVGIAKEAATTPNLKAYVDRVAARPKVREALQAEGPVQPAAAS
jgi:hypothetical protein